MESLFAVLTLLAVACAGPIMFLALPVAAFFILRHINKRKSSWLKLLEGFASSNDLRFIPASFPKGPEIDGKLDGLPIQIDNYTQGSGNSSTLYSRIRLSPEIPPDLRIAKESYFTGLSQKLLGEDIQTGLPLFDDTFVLKGVTRSLALSFLGSSTRDALWRTVRTGATVVDNGTLTYLKAGYIKGAGELQTQVDLLRALAEALTEFTYRPAAGLLHHATEDPDAGYRSSCLQALLSDFPGNSRTVAALKFAAESADVNFQFIYQQHQTEPNLTVIAALVRSGELDEPLHLAARAMLEGQFAGGLSLGSEEDGGGLSVTNDDSGGLSKSVKD
jgi:hypothetical protein